MLKPESWLRIPPSSKPTAFKGTLVKLPGNQRRAYSKNSAEEAMYDFSMTCKKKGMQPLGRQDSLGGVAWTNGKEMITLLPEQFTGVMTGAGGRF